jgi:hypothetical protein
VKLHLNRWLRRNSERYLLEAAQEVLARRYLGRSGPVHGGGAADLFWRRLFVPVYRLLPWRLRQAVIVALPGSHRRHWEQHSPPRGPAV